MQDAFDSALHEYQAANIELLYAGIGGNLKNLPRINHRELLNLILLGFYFAF